MTRFSLRLAWQNFLFVLRTAIRELRYAASPAYRLRVEGKMGAMRDGVQPKSAPPDYFPGSYDPRADPRYLAPGVPIYYNPGAFGGALGGLLGGLPGAQQGKLFAAQARIRHQEALQRAQMDALVRRLAQEHLRQRGL